MHGASINNPLAIKLNEVKKCSRKIALDFSLISNGQSEFGHQLLLTEIHCGSFTPHNRLIDI